MVSQFPITLRHRAKGFHIVTTEVTDALGELPKSGLLHLFIQHTSAALAVNENADSTVRDDLNLSFDRLAPDDAGYKHDDEGPDDMPAHVKSVITGSSISIPIVNGKLALGTWQGIYLCEFRTSAADRKLVATVIS
ncbi:secondary thiamine-phosphate synthase enzyme YjbQ [soil metagenome]